MGRIELDIRKYANTGNASQVFERFVNDPENQIIERDGKYYHKGIIPLRWEKVKENASNLSKARRRTVIEAQSGQEFLIRYGNFRKLYVNTLIAEIASRLGCIRKCVALAVGSVNPTSDYDVTLTGPKSNSIVEEFNDEFRERWGLESGVVFDTNLYGASFLIPRTVPNFDYFLKRDMKEITKRAVPDEKKITPSDFVFFINLKEDPKDMRWQRLWALAKFHLWNYRIGKKQRADDLPRKYGFLNLPDSIGNPTFRLDFQLSKNMFEDLTRRVDIDNLSAMNKQYERELNKLSRAREEFDVADDLEQVKKHGRELKNQISRANFFGNETYLSQGAFNHVVGKIQSGFDNLPLYVHEYADSFIENSFELVKEFAVHFHDVNADSMVADSSKYIMRATMAMLKLLENNLFENAAETKKYQKLFQEALKLSTQIRGFRSDSNKISVEGQMKIIDSFYQLLEIPTTAPSHKRSLSLSRDSVGSGRRRRIPSIVPLFRASSDADDLDPVAFSRPRPAIFIENYFEILLVPGIIQIYKRGMPFASDFRPSGTFSVITISTTTLTSSGGDAADTAITDFESEDEFEKEIRRIDLGSFGGQSGISRLSETPAQSFEDFDDIDILPGSITPEIPEAADPLGIVP